ncbi:hydroxymethylglutaryl-CoA synthase family protein [Pyruvatibacter mobilis]|uniref:hydroxymethylglutaryl-CoA synthase family protein n=1 Tax=Pyruvatibacter mobilis TaxID=1712261 RepID=UPI003C7DE35E
MTQDIGLTSLGGYVPRLRLQRKSIAAAHQWLAPNLIGKAKGERSMANWDEDAITMAVEAARDCLGKDDDRSHIDAIYFASTTMPFTDRLNAGIVAAALTLESGIQSADIASTQRAGTSALIQALNAVGAGTAKNALVAAGEHRRSRAASAQEMDFGDAGAALSVGTENVIAKFIGAHTETVDFVDHFRGEGEEFDYNWEERWIRDEGYSKIVPKAIAAVLEKTGVSAGDIDHFVLPCVFPRLPQSLAKKAGIDPEKVRDNLALQCGEAGAAHGLVMLVHALQDAKPGDKILALQFGQGCDALIFEATDLIGSMADKRGITGSLAQGRQEDNYMKLLVFNGLVEWEQGMRAEQDNKTALTTLYRNEDMIMGLVGGRCTKTGTVQFPRSRISVNPNDHTVDTQEPYKFAEKKAKILSWSADFLSASKNPPNHYGMITFEEGGRIMMSFTDVIPGTVDSGMEVDLAFRIHSKDDRRGFTRYFWKAVPKVDAAAGQTAQAAE